MLLPGVSKPRESSRNIQAYRPGTLKQEAAGAQEAWQEGISEGSLLRRLVMPLLPQRKWSGSCIQEMVYGRVVCNSSKRLGTLWPHSFLMTQRAAIKWYPSTWWPWSASAGCRQGKVTSLSRPVLLRSAFLLFHNSSLFCSCKIAWCQHPENHLLLTFFKRDRYNDTK